MKGSELILKENPLLDFFGNQWNDSSDAVIKEALIISNWLILKGPNTQRNYKREVRNFLKFFKGLLLKDITVSHINSYLHMQQKTLAKISVNFTRSALSSLFGYCVKVEYLPSNPLRFVDRPKYENKLYQRILTQSEVQRMIEVAPDLRDQRLVEILYRTGIRVGEAAALTWESFMDKGDVVRLSVIGKGSQVRALSISKDFYLELTDLKSIYPEHTQALFCQMKRPHAPLSTVSLFKIIQKIAVRAGLKKNVSPHWLRHSHATHALENGAPIHIVKQTLGHKSVATTDQYLNANPKDCSFKYILPD